VTKIFISIGDFCFVFKFNEFKNIDLTKLKEYKILIVIEGRNCLDKEKIKEMSYLYHGIGRS